MATISAIILDCTDPGALAEFYRKATGWEVTSADGDFVYLSDGGPISLAFQRVADHRRPGWPDPAKQAHLELSVPDVERAVEELVAAGAARPEFQPGGADWVVLTDPAGHPLCLSAG